MALPALTVPERTGRVVAADLEIRIPWVFSWAHCRVLLPGWYGVDSAVEAWLAEEPEKRLAELRSMYESWPFFRTLVDNVDMVLAKTDLGIASRYAELCRDARVRREIFGRIGEEWERTRRAVLSITGQARPLEASPLLARTIDGRLPYLDPIHHLQVELLSRHRAGRGGDRARRGLHLTINGITAGLRNSG